MNILNLIKNLWPILKPRVMALLAVQLKALAARGHVVLTDEESLGIAATIVGLIEELIKQDDTQPLVARAAEMLAAKPT